MDTAKKLIDHLMSNPETCGSDGVAYKLLNEYYRGSPVESLRTLLSSTDDRLVGEATWIASELPDEGKPLLGDVTRLLVHPSKKVRFWAIECVLIWAGASNGRELSLAIPLVDDPEEAVREQAMRFLAYASREQLQAALTDLQSANSESKYIGELVWLLGVRGGNESTITDALHGGDLRQKFAVSAALRIAKDNAKPLEQAASLSNSEVAEFARAMLKCL